MAGKSVLGTLERSAFGLLELRSRRPHRRPGAVRSGKLRALAVSSATRAPSFPNVPTAEEAGLAGYLVSRYGLFAPAGNAGADR